MGCLPFYRNDSVDIRFVGHANGEEEDHRYRRFHHLFLIALGDMGRAMALFGCRGRWQGPPR